MTLMDIWHNMVIGYCDISDIFHKHESFYMVIFTDIQKYGNMTYGNVIQNYYNISISKLIIKKPMGWGA